MSVYPGWDASLALLQRPPRGRSFFFAVRLSVHGTSRHFAAPQNLSAIGATTDIGQSWGLDACE